ARQKNPPNPSTISASSTSARPCVGAITCSFLQDLLRDDEIHDLARSLVDLRDLRVAVVALGREVGEVTVAAEDLDALARGTHRDVARTASPAPPRGCDPRRGP